MVDHLQSRVKPWRQYASHVKVRGTLSKMDVHPARMARQLIKTEPQHHLAVCHCTMAQAFSVPLACLILKFGKFPGIYNYFPISQYLFSFLSCKGLSIPNQRDIEKGLGTIICDMM